MNPFKDVERGNRSSIIVRGNNSPKLVEWMLVCFLNVVVGFNIPSPFL